MKALGNHKKVLSRGKDMVCLRLGKDLTLFFSVSQEVREPSGLG